MLIGVPKEIKTREYRVGMTPAGVRALVSNGHKVIVEKG
ncbi:MAG: alanine dehydrogenase, partial [Polyangiaceae bacterium]|nr:alanine dehydrogenase [Polyangiaceae bacterium]